LVAGVGPLWGSLEQEQVTLENQLQERVEQVLAKVLPPKSYLVTVHVELEQRGGNTVTRATNRRGGTNPFLDRSRFILPGVPEKKEFSQTPEAGGDNIVTNTPIEALVRRILIAVLVAPDVTADQIHSIRDFLSATIPFNPLRGDQMDIQTSPLIKSATPSPDITKAVLDNMPNSGGGFWSSLYGGKASLPLMLLLGGVIGGLVIVVAFLFGPVRVFFNRLLAVLPRVGEQAIYAAGGSNPLTPNATPTAAAGTAPVERHGYPSDNGRGQELEIPFHFIGEDQLTKLPLVFRELSAAQAALVLAYLPPAWASRVLATLDMGAQTGIMRELSRIREIPAETVKEVEQLIKQKLPYLVGGVDWVQSVYQSTQPETQRMLLSTLAQQAPDLAQTLRRKTFFFEDLAILETGALRVLVQDVGYPLVALSMKGEKPEFRDAVFRKLPAAMREIIQQELELSRDDKPAIAEARNRVMASGQRLLTEGRISWPERGAAKK
jgi:hypothetical protein